MRVLLIKTSSLGDVVHIDTSYQQGCRVVVELPFTAS